MTDTQDHANNPHNARAAVLSVFVDAIRAQIEDGPFAHENDYAIAMAALDRLLSTIEKHTTPSA